MENTCKVIYHSGVRGMKWGVITWIKKRKLLRKLKEGREKAKSKKLEREKILKDPSLLRKHQYEFSKVEVDDALNRFKQDSMLRGYVDGNSTEPLRYISTATNYVETGTKFLEAAIKLSTLLDKNAK